MSSGQSSKDCFLNIYWVFLRNLNEFKELNSFPVNVNFWPEVSPEVLVRSRASWLISHVI